MSNRFITLLIIMCLMLVGMGFGMGHEVAITMNQKKIESLELDKHSLRIHMDVADHHRELYEQLYKDAYDSVKAEIYRGEVKRISYLQNDIIDSLTEIKAEYFCRIITDTLYIIQNIIIDTWE